MNNNSKGFNNKFANYLNNILQKEKKERIFGTQFDRSNHRESSSSVFPFSNYKASSISHPPQSFSRRESNQTERLSSQLQESTPFKRRRLKKLKQLQENQCGICLDQIKKRCQLKCKHRFCFDCVNSWFETSNKCPYCRQQIATFWYKGEEFIVEPKRPDYDEDEEQFSQSEELDFHCYNCQNTQMGDIVLICDQCQINSCHVDCDQSLHGTMPTGEWICHFCR